MAVEARPGEILAPAFDNGDIDDAEDDDDEGEEEEVIVQDAVVWTVVGFDATEGRGRGRIIGRGSGEFVDGGGKSGWGVPVDVVLRGGREGRG